jgi:hypothetical protein
MLSNVKGMTDQDHIQPCQPDSLNDHRRIRTVNVFTLIRLGGRHAHTTRKAEEKPKSNLDLKHQFTARLP